MLPTSPSEESTPAASCLGADVYLSLFVACYNESGNIIGTLETVVAAASKTVATMKEWQTTTRKLLFGRVVSGIA